ncbi:TetR/AcrR family transcriptional regulator [Vibrio cincinnatiensis]|uniref:TetR/AcrR family transcriptional regulator n=1 Tax=Vibrio cincinnatiensis TaxID=675 RepID=UPI001EDD1DE3|nr:TetR/AcrR family transcriptional regulator [Vibrio cincinnatiensis]MCG3743641.1 TetR/AcrR family transcriptional regulator [Vibrio cincinnatiensis]
MRVKSEEKRQAILEVAKDSFTQQGFEQTSMSHIAKMLGGSKATLYNYFSSKEEIFSAVMASSATEQIANAFLSLDKNRDIATSLEEFGANFLNSILGVEAMAIYRMAIHEAERSSVGRHFYEQGPKKGWTHVSEYIAAQIDKGMLKPCDPWVAAMQFKALLSAEYVEPFALGAIDKPTQAQINTTVHRAVTIFLTLYSPQ